MSAKPKKLTKAELAKQKKDEEDRLIREEEERQWQDKIKEKLAVLKQDQKELEKKHRVELDESRFLTGPFTDKLINNFKNRWETRILKQSDICNWSQYMSCDPRPNFQINRDLSDFTGWMSLEKSRVQESVKNFTDKTQICTCMKELSDLLTVLGTYKRDNFRTELKPVFDEMRDTVNELLDFATLQLLKNASGFKDDDSGNLQLEEHDKFHDIYVWGNLANNPRLKTIDFGKPGKAASHVQVSLLKGMHNRKLAVRVIRKNYSPQNCAVSDDENIEKVEFSRRNSVFYDLTPLESEAEDEEEEEKAPESDENAESAEKLGETSAENQENMDSDEPAKTAAHIEPETLTDELNNSNENLLPLSGPDMPLDALSLDDYAITGGTWEFGVFEIPNQPKKSGKWMIRPVFNDTDTLSDISNSVVSIAKQVTQSQLALAQEEAAKSDEKDEEGKEIPKSTEQKEIDLQKQLDNLKIDDLEIELKIFIPQDQVILTAPEVAWFDEESGFWRQSGISDVKFDENTRELKFVANRFGKFAALQDRKLDLPYQSWEIKRTSCLNAKYEVIEFGLTANYSEMKLEVSSENNDIRIIQQIHEEISGTSIVVDEKNENNEDEEIEPHVAGLKIDRAFVVNNATGESAVKDLKDSLTDNAVFLFPSLTQPCSIKKVLELENSVYWQMAVLSALGVCQFKWSAMSSTQILPEIENEVSKMSVKESESTVNSDNPEGEEIIRPTTPDVSIPIKDDKNYRILREFEMIVKYAACENCVVNKNAQPETAENSEIIVQKSESSTSSDSKTTKTTDSLSKTSQSISTDSFEELKWCHALVRYPAGPCYKLSLDGEDQSEDDEEQAIFSRKICGDGSRYHSDLLHAIAVDMDLDIDSLHENAERLDLVYVNTLAGLLMETRVLTNSV